MMRRVARGLVRGVRSSLVDMRWAHVGGAVSTIIAVSGLSLVGRVSGFEGRALVESLMPTVRFLASTVATAAATILALMVTLLGLSQSMDRDLIHILSPHTDTSGDQAAEGIRELSPRSAP
ncbi:MAG: hypothetical protein ACRELC_12560 [Gemmatimonadota bacterium]